MTRILILCFIHGFKGNEDTFNDFPDDLQREVRKGLPDYIVESIVFPQYETKGELGEASAAFHEWLKERVIESRKAHLENVWPPNDKQVGVVLVGHSMGGFVAAETLFRAVEERESQEDKSRPIFPMIQGIVTFDTPFNGLARSMFVYGAFSNYQKVSNVFNAMTALTAAAPGAISRLGARRAAASSSAAATSSASSPGWKTWQLVAVRTGTVGAIAAGGVAAYTHREKIMEGVRGMGSLNRESVVSGYRKGIGSIGQGLAYVNRGNVGRSFAWLSDHFAFVGSLMKPAELARRLERIAALRGVGVHDFYVSLGENGYWSGGYFVPERTFCAVPAAEGEKMIFERVVVAEAEDEVIAHMSMFDTQKNKNYENMTERAAGLVMKWAQDESDVVDDAKFRQGRTEAEVEEDKKVDDVLKGSADGGGSLEDANKSEDPTSESPIDIAAAASLVPLPDDSPGDEKQSADNDEKKIESEIEDRQKYLQYLVGVAQQAGTGIRGWIPSKVPNVPMTKMPAMPSMPSVSMPSIPLPSMPVFLSKKSTATEGGESASGLGAPGETAPVGDKPAGTNQ